MVADIQRAGDPLENFCQHPASVYWFEFLVSRRQYTGQTSPENLGTQYLRISGSDHQTLNGWDMTEGRSKTSVIRKATRRRFHVYLVECRACSFDSRVVGEENISPCRSRTSGSCCVWKCVYGSPPLLNEMVCRRVIQQSPEILPAVMAPVIEQFLCFCFDSRRENSNFLGFLIWPL